MRNLNTIRCTLSHKSAEPQVYLDICKRLWTWRPSPSISFNIDLLLFFWGVKQRNRPTYATKTVTMRVPLGMNSPFWIVTATTRTTCLNYESKIQWNKTVCVTPMYLSLFRKIITFIQRSQASPACPSDNSITTMSTEHWWILTGVNRSKGKT